MNKVEKGKNLMLFIEIESKYTAIAAAKDCSYTVSAEMSETSSKDSGIWKDQQPTKLSWNAKSSNLLIFGDANGYDILMGKMVAMEPVKIRFSKIKEVNSKDGIPETGWTENGNIMEGEAYVSSLELTAPDGDNASYSVSFEGAGKLGKANSVAITQNKAEE